jgi:hypothetical protein
MWAKLDDGLLDHRKLLEAARLLGKDGRALALGYYTAALLYSSKHLTDGKLTPAIVDELHISPAGVRALVAVGLWKVVDKKRGVLAVHDYADWNPSAAEVLERRKYDRDRKRKEGRAGAHKRWHGSNGRADS